ncbi:MAG TPA: hypothetical protein VJ547_03215 [Candidatus Thermoplasmatota archaeon]|nr:hypothetical protein [Candidatus Thermoplasmatota archaeon]
MSDRKGNAERAAHFHADAARAEAVGDFGGAFAAYLDAAQAFEEAGAEDEARENAKRALSLWPEVEESKNLVMRAAASPKPAPSAPRRLRRLPGALPQGAPPERPATGEIAPGRSELPSMFIEMHAEALRLAGREREARQRTEEALAAVEAEVERRRAEQAWGEALSAAQTQLRIARRLGGDGRLDDVRRAFIEVARESAREALTAEYFARGKDELPFEAIEAALREARALKDEALIRTLGREAAGVEANSLTLLTALSDEHTAAEAVLSWEDSWRYLDGQKALKRALLEHPEFASTLQGPFKGLAGLAATHPARLELSEFHDRWQQVLSRSRARAAKLQQRAGEGRG